MNTSIIPRVSKVKQDCFFARHGAAGPCSGPVQKAHLIPQQRIRRAWKTAKAEHRRGGPKPFSLTAALQDPRGWVYGCRGHHHAHDYQGERLPVEAVPEATREFAAELGLGWSLEHDYRETA